MERILALLRLVGKGPGFNVAALLALLITAYGVYAHADLIGLAACIAAAITPVAAGGMVNRWMDSKNSVNGSSVASSPSAPR